MALADLMMDFWEPGCPIIFQDLLKTICSHHRSYVPSDLI